jgi:RNA polymerase sigma-70 factor (ECF subfamily)
MLSSIPEHRHATALDVFERARAGDAAAFEQLLLTHERQVLRLAFGLTNNLQDAQDVSQEVFLKLHRDLRKLRQSSEVPAWLYRVTVNACFDKRRKARRSRLVPIEETAAAWRSNSPSPEDFARYQQDRRRLESGMKTLTDRERAAIALREFEGLSTAEVAEILGSTESTVRVQISAARVKLRRFFANIREKKL